MAYGPSISHFRERSMFNLFRRKIKSPEVKRTILRPSEFTPDLAILEQYQTAVLFVADEWMRDRRRNFVLDDEGVKREGRAFTMPHFDYRVFQGQYEPDHVPVPIRNGYANGHGFKIQGEVISMPPALFLKLDKLKLNGVQFRRERIRIIKPYRDQIVFENTTEERSPHPTMNVGIDWLSGKFPHNHPLAGKKLWVSPERLTFIWAWMYVAIPKYWRQYTKSPFLFEKVPTFKPKKDKWWLTEYYRYQNPKE
jgi:hypothetical protein